MPEAGGWGVGRPGICCVVALDAKPAYPPRISSAKRDERSIAFIGVVLLSLFKRLFKSRLLFLFLVARFRCSEMRSEYYTASLVFQRFISTI